jgi:hypothetical protein
MCIGIGGADTETTRRKKGGLFWDGVGGLKVIGIPSGVVSHALIDNSPRSRLVKQRWLSWNLVFKATIGVSPPGLSHD